jgi:hypothetical protein
LTPNALDLGDRPPIPSCSVPPLPPARGFESTATVELHPRYEDIAQDGRVQLTTLMPGLGAVWRSLADTSTLDALRRGYRPDGTGRQRRLRARRRCPRERLGFSNVAQE